MMHRKKKRSVSIAESDHFERNTHHRLGEGSFMPLPHESTVNHAIKKFASKKQPSLLDWSHVKTVSNIQARLIEYEAKGRGMSFDELLDEHHNSARLASFMDAHGNPKPHKLCECHAIISGNHPKAAPMRAVMAWVKMRIDFPVNGVWLPKNTAARPYMPSHLRKAVPHSRIHRHNYYDWLETLINLRLIKDDKDLAKTLKRVKFMLETSTFPGYVMLPAGRKE